MMNGLSIHQRTYSSRLCMEAVGDRPIGEPIAHDATCITCGAPIKAGELARKAHRYMTASFNNKHHVRSGKYICGCCSAIWTNEWMKENERAKSVSIESEGLFNFKTGEDIAWLMLSPPQNPYVAIHSTRKQAHMVWRTPVAMPSERFIKLRMNEDMLIIDRDRLLDGVRAYRRANEIIKSTGKAKGVIAITSPKLADSMAGSLIESNARLVIAQGKEGAALIQTLRSLSMGEWWALTAVRHVDLDNPSSWPIGRPFLI